MCLLSKIAKLKLNMTDESCPLFFAEDPANKKHKVVTFQKPLPPMRGNEQKEMLDSGPARGIISRYSLLIIQWRQAGNVQDVARCPDTSAHVGSILAA